MACELTDRKSGKKAEPEDTRTNWIRGEYDVTGSIPQITDANWHFARADALRRAKEQLLSKYSCGGACEDADDFCVLDLRVTENRSGKVERRMVENPPDSFQALRLGQKSSEHTYLSYEIKVEALCRCASPPRSPARTTGEVQTGQANGSGFFLPLPFGSGFWMPDLGAIVGGGAAAAVAGAAAGSAAGRGQPNNLDTGTDCD